MKKSLLSLLGLAATAALGTSVANAATTYNFDVSQADYNANFIGPAAANANYSAAWQAAGGVLNSGSLDGDANQRTGYYGTTVGQFVNVNDSYFVSTRALINTSVTSTGSNLRVGFQMDPTLSLTGGGFFAAQLQTTAHSGGNATAMNIGFDSRNNAAGTSIAAADTSFGVTIDDQWYELKLTLTYQGSNNFIGVVDLLSWGTDGNTGGTLVDTFTTASISRSSMVGTNIFGGFQSSQNNAGFRTETIDQFSIIPEPSTTLLGALGVLALLRRRRA